MEGPRLFVLSCGTFAVAADAPRLSGGHPIPAIVEADHEDDLNGFVETYARRNGLDYNEVVVNALSEPLDTGDLPAIFA